MRSGKLTKRLWSYFSLLILFFSALMGSVFAFLFVEYNRESHQEELRRQAVALAEALPQLADEVFNGVAMPERAAVAEPEHSRGRQHGMMGMRHGNSGSKGSDTPMGEGQWCRRNYSSNESTAGSDVDNSMAVFLRTLDKFTRGTVWVVDKNSRTISSYGEESAVSIEDMPASINEVLEETLRGGTPVVGTSTPLFDAPMVTAGAPVLGRDGSLLGAVLVHRHLSELRAAEVTGLKILGAALALGIISSILLAAPLAGNFTAPLYRMKDTAEAFIAGRYSASTGIRQNDEIGRLGESLDELGRRLSEAEQERQALNRQRQDFLAAVSHELRTPLTVMRGTWELLESGLVNDEGKAASYRGRISENLLMLERLVGDLLELTRLQNPGFEIEMQELDLTEPFRDAVRSGTSLGEKKGVEVRESMPESIPFMGDYGRLRQLLLILLDNGVKFSTEGSTVTVNGKLEDETWQVSVEDKGRGIAPEDIPHIFERFKTDNEGNSGGTGLGLAIAGEIAQRHGIVIKCESTLGKGTRFTLEGSCIPQYQGNFQYRRNGSIS